MNTGLPDRFRILTAIGELFRTIKPQNGFISDLSKKDSVVTGRLVIGENETAPMVSLVEPPMAIERLKSSPRNPTVAGEWDILIQGWADDKDKRVPLREAYILAAEVGQVLAMEKERPSGRPGYGNQGRDYFGMGNKITNMHIGAPVVRPPDGTSRTACFYLILTLQIVEDIRKPFG